MKKREIKLKPRKKSDLPPEKLMEILTKIYPEDMAMKLFHDLQGKAKED